MARRVQTVNEVTMLGAKFVQWGLALFIFGLVIGFGPLAHYLHGAFEVKGEAFLKNVTLWFGCPWTLAVYTVLDLWAWSLSDASTYSCHLNSLRQNSGTLQHFGSALSV